MRDTNYWGVTPENLDLLQPFADTCQDAVLFVNRYDGFAEYLGAYSERWGKLTYAMWEKQGDPTLDFDFKGKSEGLQPLTDEDFEALGLEPVEEAAPAGDEDFDLSGWIADWDRTLTVPQPEFPSMDYVHVDAIRSIRTGLSGTDREQLIQILRGAEALRRLGG